MFNKKIWKRGDKLTAKDLNRFENGLNKNNNNEKLEVIYTEESPNNLTCNYTAKEIYEAYLLSKNIVAKVLANNGESIISLNLVLATHSEKEDHSESYDEITF